MAGAAGAGCWARRTRRIGVVVVAAMATMAAAVGGLYRIER